MSISYFIPDWDDRVDPNYDFLTDKHTPKRHPYLDDRYAHEIYKPAPYDGVLLSRAVIDAHRKKRQAILNAGSVHNYLRLPDGAQVMGDCGAFTYWQAYEPPYKTEEIIEYYQQLKFDIGVSIDHLIFTELEAEKERRWNITVENAKEFMRLYEKGKSHYTFIPMGVAQGWNPDSYRHSVEKLMEIGYTYIALGGLVRSTSKDILQVLEAVKPALQKGTQLHLFGVNRPEHIQTFSNLGVTSFDSASRLRRAWMDGRRNYFLGNAAFSAIRVPDARRLAKKNEGIREAEALRLERAALDALRAYDHQEVNLDTVYDAVIAYAELVGDVRKRTCRDYRETLARRPWMYCSCAICNRIGVEVIIFRGNNRNRRRGFHNTWQLYKQLHGYVQELPLPFDASLNDAGQMTFL
jgi:hypothetical protein